MTSVVAAIRDRTGDASAASEQERADASPAADGRLFRGLALAAWFALAWSYLGVFYHITDVAGGVPWLAAGVGGAFVLATLAARWLPPPVALALGVCGLLAGLAAYVVSVPAVFELLGSVAFVADLWETVAGESVLGFLDADRWAVLVAPAPVFCSWYLVVRRRYDLAAVAGGLALGFFVLSGDVGDLATLVGVVGALGLVGFGGLERAGATIDQIEGVTLGLVVVVLAARLLPLVPRVRATRTGGGGGGQGGGSADGLDGVAEPVVTGSDGSDGLGVRGHISLSPAVLFTVEADEPAYWHVGSFDRYTGADWVATGDRTPYDGRLAGPPGTSRTLRQRVTAVTDLGLGVLPAAWRPVVVGDEYASSTTVTAAGDLRPADTLEAGDRYTVESRVPVWTPDSLRQSARLGAGDQAGVADTYRELPGSTPERVRDLAADLGGSAETAYDAVVAVEAWLRTEKGYSLDVPDPGARAADAFLFEMDRGYCVHFATAMTVLCRALDVPARVAVGYQPGQRVADDRWVVRGLDSHAWVEVYFPGVGWVPFDPTPSDPRAAAESQRLDAARDANVSGVDTNESRSAALAEANATASDGPASAPGSDAVTTTPGRDGLPEGDPAATDGSADGTVGSLLARADALDARDRVTLVAAAAGVVIGARRLRLLERGREELWLRGQEPTDDPDADVERAFARLETVLGRRRRPRRESETPRRYVAALDLDRDPRVQRVLAAHEQSRYAGGTSREAADETIAAVDDVLREPNWWASDAVDPEW